MKTQRKAGAVIGHVVEERERELRTLDCIGAAFGTLKDGKGFNIAVSVVPVNGR